jgi:hypothetical protein
MMTTTCWIFEEAPPSPPLLVPPLLDPAPLLEPAPLLLPLPLLEPAPLLLVPPLLLAVPSAVPPSSPEELDELVPPHAWRTTKTDAMS